MSLRILDPREIYDLYDAMEERILEKVLADLRSEMELMKNDTVIEIMRAMYGVPRKLAMEHGYGEVIKHFEVPRSCG